MEQGNGRSGIMPQIIAILCSGKTRLIRRVTWYIIQKNIVGTYFSWPSYSRTSSLDNLLEAN